MTYVFRRPRGRIRRPHCQSNQIIWVFGDFWPKSWKTLRHVSGHVTRATCLLRVPWSGPWAVDNFRHWNYSICLKNIGVMAILVEGYNSKIFKKVVFSGKLNYQIFLWLYPSTKMAITPMFFEQIENFQCLKLSTAQGPAHGTLRSHVARVTCP